MSSLNNERIPSSSARLVNVKGALRDTKPRVLPMGVGVDVSIVLVNWNSEDYLRECIASIYENTKEVCFEIVVVDNASPAGTIDAVQRSFPEIMLVKSDKNLGFARANNLGFRRSSGAHILLLNPDTKLVGPAITTLLSHFKSLAAAGIVGARLVDPDLTIQTTSIQRFPTILNQVADIEYFRRRWPYCSLWALGPLFSRDVQPVRVEVIPGACMLLKREVFDQVGMFTEDYFMYAEDIDLNYKVCREGFVNYHVPSATVIHYGGRSSALQQTSQWATIMKYRAMRQYYLRNRGRGYAESYKTAMGCAAALRLVLIAIVQAGVFWRRDTFKGAAAKWLAVLKWSVGLENRMLERAAVADGE